MTELVAPKFTVTKARPTKALAVLSMLKAYNVDDIEYEYQGTVKGYVVPVTIDQFLQMAADSHHHVQKLSASLYMLTCFQREVFSVVPTEDKVVILL